MIRKGLLSFVLAWVSGLIVLLGLSAIRFDLPGTADLLGFGSSLFVGTLLLTLFCYLPLIRRIQQPSSYLNKPGQLPWLLAIFANLPAYLLLWFGIGDGYNAGEAFLFSVGFFITAYIFGVCYSWHSLSGIKQKSVLLFTLLPLTILSVFFDYQFLLQDSSFGNVRQIAAMKTKRSAHSATVLHDGKVLITGGIFRAEGAEINNASTEIFDPKTEISSEGNSLFFNRAGHSATLLPDGNVLIAGGFDSSGFLANAELYLTASGEIVLLDGKMSEKRAAHTATLLNNGKVLLTGGVNGSPESNKTADLYDPTTKTFQRISDLNFARTGHTSSLLENGKVLIVGGSTGWRNGVISETELFDPETNGFNIAASMNTSRNKHLAIKMNDGNILIVGGSSKASAIGGRYFSCEIYNTENNRFDWLSSSLVNARFKITNGGAVLETGEIVIGGDGKYVEVFDPMINQFYTASGTLGRAWMYPVVCTIAENKVLITGGYDRDMKTTNGVWIYETTQPVQEKISLGKLITRNTIILK